MKELLSAYSDDEVSPVERRDVEAHIQICRECKKELEELLWLKQEMEIAYPLSMEPDFQFEQSVMDKVRKYNQQKQAIPKRRFAVAGLFAVLLFSVLLLQTGQVMYMAMKFTFAFVKIGISLAHAFGSILSSVPYVVEVMVPTVIIILIFSGWSIRRLLITKTAG